jgi:hypothetical protein
MCYLKAEAGDACPGLLPEQGAALARFEAEADLAVPQRQGLRQQQLHIGCPIERGLSVGHVHLSCHTQCATCNFIKKHPH